MVRRSTSHRWLNPFKSHRGQIKRIDKRVDHADRISLVNEIIEASRQQRPLPAARQSGWKWSVNLDEKRPAGL